jgi:hypothetical protein
MHSQGPNPIKVPPLNIHPKRTQNKTKPIMVPVVHSNRQPEGPCHGFAVANHCKRDMFTARHRNSAREASALQAKEEVWRHTPG